MMLLVDRDYLVCSLHQALPLTDTRTKSTGHKKVECLGLELIYSFEENNIMLRSSQFTAPRKPIYCVWLCS